MVTIRTILCYAEISNELLLQHKFFVFCGMVSRNCTFYFEISIITLKYDIPLYSSFPPPPFLTHERNSFHIKFPSPICRRQQISFCSLLPHEQHFSQSSSSSNRRNEGGLDLLYQWGFLSIGKIGIPLNKRSLLYYTASVLNTGPISCPETSLKNYDCLLRNNQKSAVLKLLGELEAPNLDTDLTTV